jgi:uncharacterized membrane protein YesL
MNILFGFFALCAVLLVVDLLTAPKHNETASAKDSHRAA